jgi:FtsH-binding integral membrane protein
MRYANVVDVHDGGVSRFLSNVFAVMGVGVAITGVIAWWISHSAGLMEALFHLTEVVKNGKITHEFHGSGMWWAASALELAIVVALTWGGGLKRLSVGAMLIAFIVYAGLNGVTLAPVLYAYTDASVVQVFFITAGTFGACAVFGHVTKMNLLPLGTFFLVGLIGLLIALVVNIFYQSPAMDFVVSAVAVLLFAGITAYDVQALRELYYQSGEDEIPNLVVFGALKMYLDFINMLIHLLRIFGVKKD